MPDHFDLNDAQKLADIKGVSFYVLDAEGNYLSPGTVARLEGFEHWIYFGDFLIDWDGNLIIAQTVEMDVVAPRGRYIIRFDDGRWIEY